MSIDKCKDFIKDGYGTWDDSSKPTTFANMYDFMKNQNNVTLALANGLWQPGTAYSVGAVVHSPSLPSGCKATCTTAGTTDSTEPKWTAYGTTVTDGTVKWAVETDVQGTMYGEMQTAITSAITENNKIHQETDSSKITDWSNAVKASVISENIKSELLKVILPSTAAAHNSIYRGKDLTEYWDSGEMSKAIEAGTFDDIFPGDYIIKSVTINGTAYNNVKWSVGDLDYHLHRGNTETTTHHVVLFPENNLGKARMNASDTTAGGYQRSEMWTTTIPKYAAGIINAFGSSHVLVHVERLTKAVDANAYAGGGGLGNGATVYADGEWVNVTCNLFNEAMMFGHASFASSGRDTYDCNKQIAAFRYGQNFTRDTWCWLRDVASATDFALANFSGEADYYNASNTSGVRPYFLLH